ncbi:MAG: Wzt carbohydrate-binding domain-containing protein [candidate division WOR-3 bacterium]
MKLYQSTTKGQNKKAFHSDLHQSSGDIILGDTGILDESYNRTEKIRIGEPLTTFFEFETTKNFEELFFTVGIRDERNYNCIVHISDYADKIKFRNILKGKYRLIVKFITPNLVPGVYFPVIAIRNKVTNEIYERIFDLKPFVIEGNILPRGIVYTESEWNLYSISEGN